MTLEHEVDLDADDILSRSIWRLLLPASGDASPNRKDPLPARHAALRGEDWTATLEEGAASIPVGGLLLLTWDNCVWRALAGLFAHGRLPRDRGPGHRNLLRTLERCGFETEAEYAVWPSGDAPRIALPRQSVSGVRWIRRSGVLGGGGRVLWKRALARSPLITVVAWLFPAAGALVARRVR